jgi:hypothetical protein
MEAQESHTRAMLDSASKKYKMNKATLSKLLQMPLSEDDNEKCLYA